MDQKPEILVVDDDVELASNLKDILEEKGYNATVAHDGQIALGLNREKVFDLAFIDIKLPDIQGVELIEKLAELSPGTEYVIITGYATLETAIEAASHRNVIAYETKPLDMDHLLAFIRQVVDRKQAEQKLEKHREHTEELVKARTAELQSIINSMAGREVRMAELKETIRKLRVQVESAGMAPVADDPLKKM